MYDRNYAGKSVHFEASGGLTNASLVMQDQETDTYWSIMKGEAVAGELSGEKLVELPVSEKMSWGDWKKKHPNTRVLSVDGKEDADDGYADYWKSGRGFRAISAKDNRLGTKEPIFAFHYGEKSYAVKQKDLRNGQVFELANGADVFLFRDRSDKLFDSTSGFISMEGFGKKDDLWVETKSGSIFDKSTGRFDSETVERLNGFDTFWYNWSLNNPETVLLEQ